MHPNLTLTTTTKDTTNPIKSSTESSVVDQTKARTVSTVKNATTLATQAQTTARTPTKATTATSLGKGPRYDNSTTIDQIEPTEPTSIGAVVDETTTSTTSDNANPEDNSTQHVVIIQTRPNDTNEMRIDVFGPTMKTTTMPPSTKEEGIGRRPTTRIDTSLEDGYDFPSTTIGPIAPNEDDSKTSTSWSYEVVLTATEPIPVLVESSTTFSPMVVNPGVCLAHDHCAHGQRCIAGKCQDGRKPTNATKSCTTNGDCEADQRCVARRCLISCTTLTSNNTTLNPVDCYQGTIPHSPRSYIFNLFRSKD